MGKFWHIGAIESAVGRDNDARTLYVQSSTADDETEIYIGTGKPLDGYEAVLTPKQAFGLIAILENALCDNQDVEYRCPRCVECGRSRH